MAPSLCLKKKRTASAQAHGPVQCREFKTNILLKGSANVPKWYQSILKEILGRFENLENKFIELNKTVRQFEAGTVPLSTASVHLAQLLLTLNELGIFNSTSDIHLEERFCAKFHGALGLTQKTLRRIIVGFKKTGFLTSPPAGMMPIFHSKSAGLLKKYAKCLEARLASQSTKEVPTLTSEQYTFLKSLTDVYAKLITTQEGSKAVKLDELLDNISRHTGLTGVSQTFVALPSEWKLSIIDSSTTGSVAFEESKFRRKIAVEEMMSFITEMCNEPDSTE